jgi:hypothetical protein
MWWTKLWFLSSISALIVFVFSGCADDDKDDAGTISVTLEHRSGGRDLVFNSNEYTNAVGNQYEVVTLEHITSDFRLMDADGGTVRIMDHHYRNAERPATQKFTALKVPAGDYTALSFTFGIAGPNNMTGVLPNEADYNNMAWPDAIGGGYHYMKLEGNFVAGDEEGAFLVHTGPSGGGDFSIDIQLPLTLPLDGDEWAVQLVMDVNEWFTGPNDYNFSGHGGIMGNADAQTTLRENGASIFSLGFARPIEGFTVADDAEIIQRGLILFSTGSPAGLACESCHGPQGFIDASGFQPVDPQAHDLRLSTLQDNELQEKIQFMWETRTQRGEASYAELAAEDRHALTQYLLHLRTGHEGDVQDHDHDHEDEE